jgi:hypothetical protein
VIEYPGRIKRVNGDRLFIKYDDGDEEWTSPPFVRVVSEDSLPAQPRAEPAEPTAVPALDGPRWFPCVRPDLYAAGDAAAPAPAAPLLQLAHRPLSRRQRYRGTGLDGEGRLARLLYLHRLGLEAELAGQARRADFFWTELQQALAAAVDRAEDWERRPPTVPAGASGSLRSRLVREVFLETHAAFYNGRLSAGAALPVGDRAFAHARHLRALSAFADLSDDERFALLDAPARAEIGACRAARRWDDAIRVAGAMRALFPERIEYQDHWADLTVARMLPALDRNPKQLDRQLRDAELVRETIDQLEQERRRHPYNRLLFELIGQLYHLRAVKLANGGQLSDALVTVARALAYYPTLTDAQRTQESLRRAMSDLNTQMTLVESQLRAYPLRSLTPDGQRLLNESRRGRGPADTFAASAEARQITDDYRRAQGRSLWRQIGLPEPASRWDARADLLAGALTAFSLAAPPDRHGVAAAWASAAAAFPDLAGTEARVSAFLARRLFGPEEPADLPRLKVERQPLWPRGEPWAFWLFSRRDRGLKWAAAAALVLLGLASALTAWEWWARRERASSYEALLAAVARSDAPQAVEAAEHFLAAPSLVKTDGRAAQVRTLLDEARPEVERKPQRDAACAELAATLRLHDLTTLGVALARGPLGPPALPPGAAALLSEQIDGQILEGCEKFLQACPEPAKDARHAEVTALVNQIKGEATYRRRSRDAAYHQLAAALRQGQDAQVLSAAEAFLGTRPPAKDERLAEVRRLYREAFVRWFGALRQGDLDHADVQGRLQFFQQLVATAN